MMNDGGARSFSTRRLLMRWNILTKEASVCAWLGVCHMAPTRAVPETKGGRSWWHHLTSHPSASALLAAHFRASPTEQPVGGNLQNQHLVFISPLLMWWVALTLWVWIQSAAPRTPPCGASGCCCVITRRPHLSVGGWNISVYLYLLGIFFWKV